jgi:hypothetical protein
MVDTILTAIGDAAALAAALFAFMALGRARETITIAKDTLQEAVAARQDAERAVKDAAAERRKAEREREWRRIEHVGEIVEAVAYAAENNDRWKIHCNRLKYALLGLEDRFQQTAQLEKCPTAESALSIAELARTEVERELKRFSGELAQSPS